MNRDGDYTYAVARIRSQETGLLNRSVMEQLLSAENEAQCIQLLNEHGWGGAGQSPDAILRAEEEKTWTLLKELVHDQSVFDVFLIPYDYHNLKAAVKEQYTAGEHPGIFVSEGTIPAKRIAEAVAARDFGALPKNMQACAAEAADALLKTRDGQLCDCIIDRAALVEILRAGRESGCDMLSLYAEETVAAADIRIASRAARTGKDRDFLKVSLAPCSGLSEPLLADAVSAGIGGVCSYLETTDYSGAAEALKASDAAFERWCCDRMMDQMRPQLFRIDGVGPLAAYLVARQTEIRYVRIILSCKRNGFDAQFTRERIGRTYV